MNWKERTELLLGKNGIDRLSAATVVVVGVGGVGAAAAEMLVRAGVGHIVLIDSDCVSETNINRQLPARHSTVGLLKTEVLTRTLTDINPHLQIETLNEYVSEDNMCIGHPTFVVDAIDTLSPKIALIQYCLREHIPMVSSMGAGAKMDVTAVRIDDISRTRECPLAHMLRKRLHKLGIRTGFPAVYSVEKPVEAAVVLEESRNKKSQVGTISYLPTVFGCACAQVAIEFIVK
ncbi:MAG: tRNA threonylcarbamoyladenosine dehydratase [Bacteroidales bacterium]|nr:tRNA threonylcarbamoyladenosine dehydratase [Bacteroidales bacterium]